MDPLFFVVAMLITFNSGVKYEQLNQSIKNGQAITHDQCKGE